MHAEPGPSEVVTPEPYLALRVVALLALAVGVNLWLEHHQGWRLASASIVSMFAAAVTGGLGLITKTLSKSQQEGLLTQGLSLVRFVFWVPFLVVAWIAALVLALTLSSVTVVAESEDKGFTAALTPGAEPRTPADDAFLPSKKGAVHIPVATNPFGRVMRLTVPGYVPATLDVPPLFGRRVALGSDMRPSPSVLLRLPYHAHGLLSGARLVVRRVADSQALTVAEVATQDNRSAFLLGRRREVPATLRRDWEIELEADGVTRSKAEGAPLLAMMLKEWRHPSPLETTETTFTLAPGMTLVAELRAEGGIVATATVTLSAEPFQDVALRDPKE